MHPGEDIDLASSSDLLQIARDTVQLVNRYKAPGHTLVPSLFDRSVRWYRKTCEMVSFFFDALFFKSDCVILSWSHLLDKMGKSSSQLLTIRFHSLVLYPCRYNEWSPTNGMCLAWPPAARVANNATQLLYAFQQAANSTMMNNLLPNIVNHPDSG